MFHLAGYILVLALIKRLVPPMPIQTPDQGKDEVVKNSSVTVIVPVYNEEKMILQKIQNLQLQQWGLLDIRVLVVDGGSKDATVSLLKSYILGPQKPSFPVEVLESPLSGKINQLNLALSKISPDHYVVVTDADTMIETTDGVVRAIKYLKLNTNVSLVGAWTKPPAHSHLLNAEHAYWDKQNRLRFLETNVFTSSIVVAPFYAFKRNCIDYFPTDCVADDVHIAMVAHQSQNRVIYAHDIVVIELRQPGSFTELFRHKLRKAHAYTTELLRVLYRLPYMGKRAKFLYGFKLYQFFYLPWALIAWGISILNLIFFQNDLTTVILSCLALAGITIFSSLLLKPAPSHSRGGFHLFSILISVYVLAAMNIILIANFMIFPFWRQNSNYRKVTGGLPAPGIDPTFAGSLNSSDL